MRQTQDRAPSEGRKALIPEEVHGHGADGHEEVARLVVEDVAHGLQDQGREGDLLAPEEVRQRREQADEDEDAASDIAHELRVRIARRDCIANQRERERARERERERRSRLMRPRPSAYHLEPRTSEHDNEASQADQDGRAHEQRDDDHDAREALDEPQPQRGEEAADEAARSQDAQHTEHISGAQGTV